MAWSKGKTLSMYGRVVSGLADKSLFISLNLKNVKTINKQCLAKDNNETLLSDRANLDTTDTGTS
jgi:hypothetical protein